MISQKYFLEAENISCQGSHIAAMLQEPPSLQASVSRHIFIFLVSLWKLVATDILHAFN